MSTVRTKQMELGNILFAIMKCTVTNLTLILTIAAVIVIDILMWSVAKWANNSFGNIPAVTAIDRLDGIAISFTVVFDKESIILFDRFKDYGKLINLKLLILRRLRIVKSKLLKGNKSANKIAEKRNNL